MPDQLRVARRVLTAALTFVLTGTGVAEASPIPDSATCAALVKPGITPLPSKLQKALLGTLQTYTGQWRRFEIQSGSRSVTKAQRAKFNALNREVSAYLARLLSAQGWPSDTAISSLLADLLTEGQLEFCAGTAALGVSTTPEERGRGASLTDRGLLDLGHGQRYGTVLRQVGRRFTPDPIEDESEVDARRAELGLAPLTEVLARRNANLPARTPPAGPKRPVNLNSVCRELTTQAALNTPLSAEVLDQLDDEAVALVKTDQRARGVGGKLNIEAMLSADTRSTLWLRQTLKAYGYPSANRADAKLSFNVWLLTQHADADRALQACVLNLLGQQRSTLAESQNFAYLTDRVLLGKGEPQLYGTQLNYDELSDVARPQPIRNAAQVGERRAEMGLEPLADYLKSAAAFFKTQEK